MTVEEFKEKVFILKDKLYRFSKRILNDETEAQDITQDVLMKLWNMRNSLHKYNSIEAFAMTATRNLSLDRARRKNLRYQKAPEIKYESETVENTDKVEQDETAKIIRNAIQNLKEPQRTIMHLRDIEQYDFDEIEPIVNMTTETIRVNLSRARKKVREEIKKIMSYGTARV
ncbi:MAG: sigma-70 family RNA polymerase sigma factor [Salinivirgaceae bacterium]|jgi:RNA polymerase sigma factor (sigma-70 family)|nr:sigma-70 family RNA polymerase sigma factor [Salinivirgaceae bacterium]